MIDADRPMTDWTGAVSSSDRVCISVWCRQRTVAADGAVKDHPSVEPGCFRTRDYITVLDTWLGAAVGRRPCDWYVPSRPHGKLMLIPFTLGLNC